MLGGIVWQHRSDRTPPGHAPRPRYGCFARYPASACMLMNRAALSMLRLIVAGLGRLIDIERDAERRIGGIGLVTSTVATGPKSAMTLPAWKPGRRAVLRRCGVGQSECGQSQAGEHVRHGVWSRNILHNGVDQGRLASVSSASVLSGKAPSAASSLRATSASDVSCGWLSSGPKVCGPHRHCPCGCNTGPASAAVRYHMAPASAPFANRGWRQAAVPCPRAA